MSRSCRRLQRPDFSQPRLDPIVVVFVFVNHAPTRDAYLPPAPLAPLDEPVLFEPDPERGVVSPLDLLIVPVLISSMSAGAPRIIAPSVRLSGPWLILYDDSGCGLMEPSDPMSLYDPARLFD